MLRLKSAKSTKYGVMNGTEPPFPVGSSFPLSLSSTECAHEWTKNPGPMAELMYPNLRETLQWGTSVSKQPWPAQR